jgi:myo-inositol-1(or 4)-monophosphatase
MLEIAKRAAVEAGKAILFLRKGQLKERIKSNASDIVTEADIVSDRIIDKILKRSFPTHSFISEETVNEGKFSQYTWIIDPLDGTLGYAGGLPFYGVSIGLVKNNKPYLGVINLPAFGSLYWAEKGKGAYLNGKKIKVAPLTDLSRAIISFDYHFAGGRKKDIQRILIKIADKVRYPPTFACSVVSLAYVAQGICHGNIHSAYPWDFLAGAAIIEEAGGRVTDYQGKAIDWSKKSIDLLATNGSLHKEILSIIK